MKRRAWVGLMALLLIAAAWPPAAGDGLRQGGEAVTLNGTLTVLEPENEVLVRVRGGVPVTITLTSADFDTVLGVYDSIGQQVAYNDDNDTELRLPNRHDSAVIFTPAADSLLAVRVGGYGGEADGAYTLTLHGVEVVEQRAISIVQNAGGSVVAGLLNLPTDRLAYAFQAASGAAITLTLTSTDFDTVLEIYDAAGTLIASNDDHDPDLALPRRTDSAVTFDVPADGRYAALVRSFEGEGGGRFLLTIEGSVFGVGDVPVEAGTEEPTCDNVLDDVAAASSAFGSDFSAINLIDGDLTTGWSSRSDDTAPYLIFEVSGSQPVMLGGVMFDGFSPSAGFANDSVRSFEVAVSLEMGDPETFTPVLQAEAPRENTLRYYAFPPTEARYVMLRPLSNYGGTYFEATEFNACSTLGGSLSGEPPYVISAQLRPGQPYMEYRLYALENAQMTATLTSLAFDPVLEIYDADGRRLADNDDHGPEFDLPALGDAALTLALPDPGLIVVRVRSFAGGGPFTLTIDGAGLQARPPETATLPPCRDVSSAAAGGAVVGFSSEFGGRWLAEYLIDGDEERGWASSPGEESARPEYVILDLVGGVQRIGSIRINPSATGGDDDAYNVSRFAVLVSTTDTQPAAFEQVFATLLDDRYHRMLAFDLPEPVEARYVMLETRDTFGGRWHEVAEFTVCAAGL